jgi:DNA-directed RNA polymerase
MNFVTSEGTRTTTTFWSLTQFLDIKKTSSALKPNTIHALDAALVRLTIFSSNYTIATIHDSFGAPLYDIENVINLVNKNLNLIFYKAQGIEWYSNRAYYSVYVIY